MKQLQFFNNPPPLSEAKKRLDSLLRDYQAVNILRFSLILLGLLWLGFGISYRFIPPEVPLLYSRPRNTDQLVSKHWLVLLPALLTGLFVINTRLASLAIKNDRLIAFILLYIQLLCGLIANISLYKLIFLIT